MTGKAATGAGKPAARGSSAAGQMLRDGFSKITAPRATAVELLVNPHGERYLSRSFAPVKALRTGVLKPRNRFGPLASTDDDDADDEAAAAPGDEEEAAEVAGDEEEAAAVAGGEEEAAAAAGGDQPEV